MYWNMNYVSSCVSTQSAGVIILYLQKVRFSNGFGIRMFGIRAPTVDAFTLLGGGGRYSVTPDLRAAVCLGNVPCFIA